MRAAAFNDFHVTLPPDWSDASTIVFVAPAREDFTPNITILRDPLDAPVRAEQYARSQRRELEEELEEAGFHVLSDGPLRLEGVTAYQCRHTFILPDTDIRVQQLQVYVVRGDVAITITATDRADFFEQSKPHFLGVIRSFKFV